jgi:hypothetical protein
VPSAIAALFLARLARLLGASETASWLLALAWGLATMALPYSTLFYGNQLAASLLIIAFTLLAEARHGAPATLARMATAGGLLGVALAAEYPAALIAIPIAIYALRYIPFRRCAWAIAGGAVPLAALAVYHQIAFGSPFAFPYDYSVWETPHTGWFMGLGMPSGEKLLMTLFSQYRGLFFITPWLALAVPGAIALARRGHRAEVIVCAISVLLLLWLNCSIPPWHGGWAPGPRYLVPCLPFMAALASGVFINRRAVIALVAALVIVSAANMFAATAVKPEIETNIARPYSDFVWPSFLAGELSLSKQSIDMRGNPARGPYQAWNLGMQAGGTGLASLVPLLLCWLGCAVWLRRSLTTNHRSLTTNHRSLTTDHRSPTTDLASQSPSAALPATPSAFRPSPPPRAESSPPPRAPLPAARDSRSERSLP